MLNSQHWRPTSLTFWDAIFFLVILATFPSKNWTAMARRTHMIYWNTSNTMFRVNALKEIYTTATDELVFVCPNRYPTTNKVFWTLNEAIYTSCQSPVGKLRGLHQLVDCFTKSPAYQYILNISSLIDQLHHSEVRTLTRVYFLAEEILCKQKNMHINMTVFIPNKKAVEPSGTNLAMADSAAESEDILPTSQNKPFLTENSLGMKPKNKRFIGLLIAYILITLLVVYMVVCAVCFQPHKCTTCYRCTQIVEEVRDDRPKETQRRCNRFYRPTTCTHNTTNAPSIETVTFPRSNRHFSRNVDGERFVYRETSLELLQVPRTQHSLTNLAIPNNKNNNYSSSGPSMDPRLLLDCPEAPFFDEHQGYAYLKGETPIFISFDNPRPLHRDGARNMPVTFTKIAC